MDKKEIISELGKLASQFEDKKTITDNDRKVIVQTIEKISSKLKRKKLFQRLT